MKPRVLPVIAFVAAALVFAGCGGESRSASAAAAPDHAAEARATITADNMDQRLAELEAAITAEETALRD
jgi:hypothetical protein